MSEDEVRLIVEQALVKFAQALISEAKCNCREEISVMDIQYWLDGR